MWTWLITAKSEKLVHQWIWLLACVRCVRSFSYHVYARLLYLNVGVFRFHLIYSDEFVLKFDSKINEIERSRGFVVSHLTVSRLLLIALEMNLSSVVYDRNRRLELLIVFWHRLCPVEKLSKIVLTTSRTHMPWILSYLWNMNEMKIWWKTQVLSSFVACC